MENRVFRTEYSRIVSTDILNWTCLFAKQNADIEQEWKYVGIPTYFASPM